jgi:hypothetical protein
MNILLVLKSYNSACSILKKFNYKLYLYKCANSKFTNINKLDESLFNYIDVIIVNDVSKKELIEKLVNSFNGNKHIYLFSNLNFKITNTNCVYCNYVKLEKIISFLSIIENTFQNLTLTQSKQETKQETNIILRSDKSKEAFRSLCVKYLDYIREVDLPIISQNNIFEAVLVEYRCLPHLEFLIRNCTHKLGSEWSQTIICGNLNFEYIINIVKNINRDIKVIKTDYDNLSSLKYSDMLMTRDFWDLLVGEKILIYQEDACIFKNNINDFLEWDYIGAPFDEINNHQNGGLSLRTRGAMIDIIENAYPLDIINCKHGKNWMNVKKHDKLPEDIFYTQHMKINTKWKLAPLSSAQLFSCENKFNCDSFGMHCYWLGNGVNKWKQHFEQFLQKYTCKQDLDTIPENNCSTYLQNSNMKRVDEKQVSSEKINKDFIGTDCTQYESCNLEHINSTSLVNSEELNENNLCDLEEFNVKHYRLLNHDLRNMTDDELISHYLNHGKNENRWCFIENYNDDINERNDLKKDCVFLISHEATLTGAPIFLYDLCIYLQENNIFKNVIICDVCKNNKLYDIYADKLQHEPIYYYNKPELLKKYLDKYNPLLIYSNSLNTLVYNLPLFEKYHSRIFFHFHETLECLLRFISEENHLLKCLYKNKNNIFVVSENIKIKYVEHFKYENIHIFPAFLDKKKQAYINTLYNEKYDKLFNNQNITFCMIGPRKTRKGYDTFLKVSNQLHNCNFLWIGGNDNDNKNIIKQKNLVQISQTNNPYKYLQEVDYLFVTSREDPCPIIILESLYLKVPCIVLDKNITYEHNIENYHTIKNHNNDSKKIINYLKNCTFDKMIRPSNLNDYIKNDFTIPLVFRENKSKNKKNILIISLYNVDNIDYYKDIINYIKLQYLQDIFVLLCVNTGKIFNQNNDIVKINNYFTFGIEQSNFKINEFEKYFRLPHNEILFLPNRGYDVGSLMVGLKFVNEYTQMEDVNLIFVHSKTNDIWRNELFKILNYNHYTDYDTILAKKFYIRLNKNTDLNYPILEEYNHLFKIDFNKPVHYIGGTIFRTKIQKLKPLVENFNIIYEMLTDINKDDIYWRKIMMNDKIFNKYYKHSLNDFLNKPIDKEASDMLIKTSSKNFIELFKNGYRGIPDCQIEHALERYIGYLITKNSSILLVQ